MTFLPILTPWLFWTLSLLLIAAAAYLLVKGRSAARWRYALVVLLVVLAGARPGFAGAPAPVASTDLNVFFVVDMTPSSAAEDFNGAAPRLEGMKADILALANEFAGARFSLISFDSKAKVVLPLTSDATALATLTEILTPSSALVSQGSSISVANKLLAQRLAAARTSHPERPRLVYYLGDGEQTAAASPEPFTATAKLTDGGAVLGYGTTDGGKMRDYTFGSDKPGAYIPDKANDFKPALSVIDEPALQTIAGALKVPYVHRTSTEGLGSALSKAAPTAASTAESPAGMDNGAGRWEIYWLLALAAFGILLWEVGDLTRSWRALQRPAMRGKP
ncbi:Ca-activated chloride channel family protein [Arthrobacter alpinus]|uniref:Ca-activated chloride channel family protein n=1 Tax=Arthrobacter alpinus TaxID=656366 RepID=A0A1H5G556_9MICC|nr:vWA domain-containing protein [Arthrobacter alpinus]SEE10873.1 Ca-activated chloride channel family protein [Arthrobacter alpinus]